MPNIASPLTAGSAFGAPVPAHDAARGRTAAVAAIAERLAAASPRRTARRDAAERGGQSDHLADRYNRLFGAKPGSAQEAPTARDSYGTRQHQPAMSPAASELSAEAFDPADDTAALPGWITQARIAIWMMVACGCGFGVVLLEQNTQRAAALHPTKVANTAPAESSATATPPSQIGQQAAPASVTEFARASLRPPTPHQALLRLSRDAPTVLPQAHLPPVATRPARPPARAHTVPLARIAAKQHPTVVPAHYALPRWLVQPVPARVVTMSPPPHFLNAP